MHACDDGCLAYFFGSCSPMPSPKDSVDPCCCTPGRGERRQRVFTPVWASPNDLSEIKVTPAFLVDHSPDEILKAIGQTLDDLGVSV